MTSTSDQCIPEVSQSTTEHWRYYLSRIKSWDGINTPFFCPSCHQAKSCCIGTENDATHKTNLFVKITISFYSVVFISEFCSRG